jgi:Cof subfamily protein (haloacid dehalogenase superfamily)
MSIKLVAIDIDGTLVTDEKKITPEVFEAIQEAKRQGVKIVICTGRPLPGVKGYLNELNLMDKGDYVIVFNGGLVQETSTGEEFVRYTMTHDDYLEIEMWSRKLGVHMHAITNDAIYTANRNIGEYTINEAFLVKMPVKYRTPEEMSDKEIVKMMYIDAPEKLAQTIENVPLSMKENYTTVQSTPYYYEILNKRANKGAALLALAEKLGIDQSETMAIGDEANDLAMLEVAGLSVAMGNATESVKAACDVITETNNNSGVAVALRKWVLK